MNLIPLYREMAATGVHFPGLGVLNHKDEIRKLIKQHGAKKLLDYGCGRGEQYKSPHRVHKSWGLQWWDVVCYDPAFEEHQELPHGKFDGVLCSDVLEHIPEDQVDDFVKKLFGCATKFVWASVCCRPAKKTFPDGVTNLHVTLRPLQWWHDKLTEHSNGIPFYLTETP